MIFIFFIIFLPGVRHQESQKDPCLDAFCNPQLGDLMVGRSTQLSATSTCGLDGPQNYCIIGYLEGEQKCFTCDSRLPYDRYGNADSHRIENIITTFDPEGKTKWWQSENGVHEVSIQLDLETVFQFSHLVLTFKSFRPAAMLVERSKDFGQNWKVIRYFAEDCSLWFPSVSKRPAGSIDDVVCDSRYSGSDPSTNGEVVLKALDPIFELGNPYATNIQDLITVTNIRVNFTGLFTLGDTLLGRRRRNPQDKYYYALYNMVVKGHCFCNGHASRCTPVDGRRGDVFAQTAMIHGRCVCQHNTAGENCERCQDFHHDSPWRPGWENPANTCRRCNCNGHSDACHFDASRFEATGGLSGGICEDCRHHRMGSQCESCGPFHYQDPQRATDDPQACIPCDCDPVGSEGGGLCDALTGRCVCKQNVGGPRCDECKVGFFSLREDNLAGCEVCRCHVLGSLGSCDKLTGNCVCDHLASGPQCDQCLAGFWGLGTSGFRCSPCDCDPGGAHSNMCSPQDGQCHCLPNMGGQRCSDPAPGFFLPSLDYFLYEAELAAPLHSGSSSFPTTTPPPSSSRLVDPVVVPQCKKYYREQGYDFNYTNGRVILVRRTRRFAIHRRRRQQNSLPLDPGHALQIIPRQRNDYQSLTWTGLGLVRVLDGAGLRFTVDNLPSSLDYQLVIHYEPESSSDWLASVSIIEATPGDAGCRSDPTGSKSLPLPGRSRGVLDSPVCLTRGSRYFVDVVFNKHSGSDGFDAHILVDSIGLIPSIEAVQDFCSQRDVESLRHFHCIGLAVELQPEESLPKVCEGITKSLSAQIHNGALPCRCNPDGSVGPLCSEVGGFCECKPNVIGRCCDTCATLTFGFGPDGCKPCECDPRGSLSELCEQVRGQCVCRSELTGRRCDRCHTAFWDFPSCRPCECNNLSDVCDEHTGECLNCREHATGDMCERCVEGYYGNPVSGQPCQPCLCPEVPNSKQFFATSCKQDPQSLTLICKCREGHTGPRCDRCSPGFYGNLELPGNSCKQCPCNNNINPGDRDACNSLTGECQRCLYNTMGPRCQDCKPGYYGDAMGQACKECACDRRGTVVTQCPLGSPCFCNSKTGQCPCRTGVLGILCDECADGYWNLEGASGCQACSCDFVNSFSNICNKVTGQCPCRPEFGGRQCDECGENHFGNPDLQCISCDCNVEGTERPSCHPETGECICRVGVFGIFCDECAPGYNSEFPACNECHPCTALWTGDVTDVQRTAVRIRTFLPPNGYGNMLPDHLQQMLNMHSELESLAELKGLSHPKLEKLEKLCAKMRKLKDGIDPNVILIDPSPLLNTEINLIRLEFKNLVAKVKAKLIENSENKVEYPEERLDEIQKLHEVFMLDEMRVRNGNKAVEDSKDTRQEVKHELSMCSSKGDMVPLEKKIQQLSMVHLKKMICGGPGVEGCSGCGEALCGEMKCGGPNCEGVLPISQKAVGTADRAKERLITLSSSMELSKNKINDAQRQAQDTRDQGKNLHDCVKKNMDSVKSEKNKTKGLIQQVKDYLIDDMVPPEDIDKMAKAVLDMQLPKSPDQIRSMINDINNLLSNATTSPKNLDNHTKDAQTLVYKAQEVKEWTRNIHVKEISRDIYKAEEAQSKANNNLDTGSQDKDVAKDRIKDIKNQLDNIEAKLMSPLPESLKDKIDALRRTTEHNRDTARRAQEAADSAFQQTTDTELELGDMIRLFELLKQKTSNQTAAERLTKLMEEAEKIKEQVEERLLQLFDMEEKIQQLIQNKEDKESEVAMLLKIVDSLQQEIAKRAEGYSICTS
ncbi:laminin subunit beta-4 isoform X2 [Pungitius pungitius]|uniref:laminin subunit beta-4 isoform X2 n=1 Tax=Pungitius pungitius TaxID=134920 RepID=UPI002E126480